MGLFFQPAALLAAILLGSLATPASALNILLTNDDGYRHPNIRALYQVLKARGHRVRIAAPQAEQSAKGGAFFYGVEVTPGRDEDPRYPDSHYLSLRQTLPCVSEPCRGRDVVVEMSATPVMAALYGLEKVMPEADLVISGPNPGNNLGFINHYSGTFNAALLAVQGGKPTLAVSTDLKEQDAEGVAQTVADLVDDLVTHQDAKGAPLLPPGVGININLPARGRLQGVRWTRIGTWVPFDLTYLADLGSQFPGAAGRFGLGFKGAVGPTIPPGEPGDGGDGAELEQEAVALAAGYATLSLFGPGLGPVSTPVAGELRKRWPHPRLAFPPASQALLPASGASTP